MTEINDIIKQAENRMKASNEALKSKFSTINTGRANPDLLNPVKVEAYGSVVELNQLANISAPEAKLLLVNIWDKALVSSVDSAIRAANLGFNPVVDGTLLKIHIPPTTEERRKELVKLVSGYTEETKISHKKTHRREALDQLENLKKSSEISEDDYRIAVKKIETSTTSYVDSAEDILNKKIQELKTV